VNQFINQTHKRIIRGVARLTGAGPVLRQLQDQSNRLGQSVASSFHGIYELQDRVQCLDREAQVLLTIKYKELLNSRSPLPDIADVQFRSHSQNQEDGVLLYIFALIGTTNKKVVEICAGNGIECNAAKSKSSIITGWDSWFDGNEQLIEIGKKYYAENRDTAWLQPNLVHAWVTAENVSELILNHRFEGEIDLLSLDMDGIDYWVWKAIECISPRVIVLEFNWTWGTERSVTIPYRPKFTWDQKNERDAIQYYGASLPAFVKLGREKGYRLMVVNTGALTRFSFETTSEETFSTKSTPRNVLRFRCNSRPSILTCPAGERPQLGLGRGVSLSPASQPRSCA
jgi:hypothetical protein